MDWKDSKQERGEDDKNSDSGIETPQISRERRPDLVAIGGLRFFATFFLLFGSTAETLWIDNGHEADWFTFNVCSIFQGLAKDLVSFYFILSGFTCTWGYLDRDFADGGVHYKFVVKRFTRFYPDYFISTVLTLLVKAPFAFGCHVMSTSILLFNLASLFLITAWFHGWVDGGYVNGPSWFMVCLFWLWMFFPFLLGPVKHFFKDDSHLSFSLKILLLWFISFLPFLIILYLGDVGISRWKIRGIPLVRLPEFIMGMGLATYLSSQKGYRPIDKKSAASEYMLVGALPIIIMLCVVPYYVYMGVSRGDCPCLQGWAKDFIACYGYFEIFDTRFAPISLLMIYSIARMDLLLAASRSDRGPQDSEQEEFTLGPVGDATQKLLRNDTLCEAGNWGLQLFLFKTAASTIAQEILVVLGIMESRCNAFALGWFLPYFYTFFQVAVCYLFAWVFNEKGPIGGLIASQVQKLLPEK